MSGLKYHLSCASLSLSSLSDSIESVSKAFDGWQIVAEGKHGLTSAAKEFRDVSQSYDLEYTVHVPFSDINIASLNRAIRLASVTEIAECLRRGADLGISKFVTHAGAHSVLSYSDRERAFLLSRESIKSLSVLSASLGVELLVENMCSIDSIARDGREMKMLIAGTKAGICLDFAHAALTGKQESFADTEQMIGMLHLSDNDLKSDSHSSLGTGGVDCRAALEMAKRTDLPVVIEARSIEEGRLGKEYLEKML